MRRSVVATAIFLSIVGLSGATEAEAEIRRPTSIPAQGLAPALQFLAKERDIQVVYRSELVGDRRTSGATGELTLAETLLQLLSGTGLTYQYLGEKAITIVPLPTASAGSPTGAGQASSDNGSLRTGERRGERTKRWWHRLAQTAPGSGMGDDPRVGERDSSGSAQDESQDLPAPGETGRDVPEIVITGSRIRGRAPAGSKVITIDREQIERTGRATVQDVIGDLPQNFGGGISEDTRGGPEADTNSAASTAINLRGLGAGATLVLVDGRRIAPAGTEGRFTDLSNIPLSAVERIEVLPDGASSLYGSDAIAGVVNIILRKNYDGAESSARYGGTTDGPLRETQLSQLVDTTWSGGNVLAALEFYERTELPHSSREQASSDLRPFGGSNLDTNECNPGTILAGTSTYAIPAGQDGTGLSAASFAAGTLNECEQNAGRLLLSDQERINLLGRFKQELTAGVAFFLDLAAARRTVHNEYPNKLTMTVDSSNPFFVNPTGSSDPITIRYDGLAALGPNLADIEAETLDLASGLQVDLGGWQAVAHAGRSLEREDQVTRIPDFAALSAALSDPDPATAFNPFADGVNTSPATLATIAHRQAFHFKVDNQVDFVSVVMEGPVLATAAGVVRAAVGGEARRESIESTNEMIEPAQLVFATADVDRSISALFGELSLPLAGPDRQAAFARSVELSLSGRYEDYPDFGSVFVPRAGLRWGARDDFALRGSWARAFKAPRLAQLNEAAGGTFISDVTDPAAPGGSSPVLFWTGPNADLEPEEATTWTVGADFHVGTLRASATYFSTRFDDRIETPSSFEPFIDPNFYGTVIFAPTAAQLTDVCSRSPYFGNFSSAPGTCTTTPVTAIIDSRARNISGLKVSGIDFDLTYATDALGGDLGVSIGGTRLLDYSRAVQAGSPFVQFLDKLGNPIDLRARSSVTWSDGPFELAAFVNYADDYIDNSSESSRGIGSWTTVDLALAYTFPMAERNGPTIRLTAQNLFDEPAPFVNNVAASVGYDPENADLIGRVVRLSAMFAW